MQRKYTTDDLLHLAKLQRFGSEDMNALAASAFLYIKKLEEENKALKQVIAKNSENIQFFSVAPESEQAPK